MMFSITHKKVYTMFSSKTCFLYIILIILPNSQTEIPTARKKFENFIVGGKLARIEDFPHSAFLAVNCRKEIMETFTCGSSILNQWILLTAAHCLDDCQGGSTVLVAVGNSKKTEGTFHSARRFVCHKHYDGNIMKNDIALMVLQKPLQFSSRVKRIVLTKVGIYDEPAILAGWGVTNVISFYSF